MEGLKYSDMVEYDRKYNPESCDTSEIECISEEVSRCTSPGIVPQAANATLSLEASMVLQFGKVEEMNEDSVGGTYWLKNGDCTIGILKPGDMEPGMKHNNKGYSAKDVAEGKVGFEPGKGYIREVVAYKLDKSFAKVPETIVLETPSAKLGRSSSNDIVKGSAQRFVANNGQSWDFGPARFTEESVRRIGIMDLRMLNCDRHGGNMLLVSSKDSDLSDLIPIDHGYCFPTSLADLDFEWQFWKQAKSAFSDEELKYVADIDIHNDIAICESYGMEQEAIDLFHAGTICLKVGCELGLNLSQMASFFRRETLNQASGLELLISDCRSSLDDECRADIAFYKLKQKARLLMASDWKAALE